jgi:medium-chain acyl-[acyl-carrier-protein] hydrolase
MHMAADQDVILVWKDEYAIHSYEVDSRGCVTLPMLCQFMQESAWNHAQHLGVGYSHLIEKDLLWVLARQLVAISSFPRWGERIRVHTWPTGKDRLFCYRDFKLLNDQDQVIGAATTTWFVIDVMKRKPQRADSYFDVVIENAEHVFSRKLTKIEPLRSKDRLNSVKVGYKDLDINEHVNNVRYIEWILESYPFEFQKHHRVREMEINYLSEARHDDTITACCEEGNGLSFLHSLIRDNDGAELCRAKTNWAEDKS